VKTACRAPGRRLMRENGLRPVWRRRPVHTTDSQHDNPVFENVLDRQFEQDAPNRAWVSDITYVRTDSGWLYLAAVLDLFSRKVVGWAAAPDMPARLVCDALGMALAQRARRRDSSSTPTPATTTARCCNALTGSMSRKGDCVGQPSSNGFGSI
jgi:transposase InsO family protein